MSAFFIFYFEFYGRTRFERVEISNPALFYLKIRKTMCAYAYNGGVGELRKLAQSIFICSGVNFSRICVIKKIKESGNAMCIKSFFFTATCVLKFEV